ncbi:MFS transporter [Reinekea sp.]|jgi:DHA1 family bicyclomycin/chloramphenicol resistance-like MFS transporter|uniref:MFS transporter n=1 Tax=Reinekea sp. TaxID=1970455 RepID=UPI00398A1A42
MPTNPRATWGFVEFVVVLALINALTTFSTESIVPAQIAIGAEFGINDRIPLQYIISIMFWGMMAGEWLMGPLSDAYGRRPIMNLGLLLFVLGTCVVLLSHSFDGILFGRFIQGLGMAACKITTRAIVRDSYSGDEMARISSFMAIIFIFVPMVAPVFGEIVFLAYGWRAVVWSWLFGALLLIFWFFIRQKESLPIEDRRLIAWQPIKTGVLSIIRNRRTLGFTLTLGCLWGFQLQYLSNAKSLITDIYGIERIGFVMGLIAVGMAFSAAINGSIVRRFGSIRLAKSAIILIFLLSIVDLAVLNVTNHVPWIYFLGSLMIKFSLMGFCYGNLTAAGMVYASKIAGLAASFMSALSSVIGLVLSKIAGMFYNLHLDTFYYPMAIMSALTLLALMWSLSAPATKN